MAKDFLLDDGILPEDVWETIQTHLSQRRKRQKATTSPVISEAKAEDVPAYFAQSPPAPAVTTTVSGGSTQAQLPAQIDLAPHSAAQQHGTPNNNPPRQRQSARIRKRKPSCTRHYLRYGYGSSASSFSSDTV